MMQVAALLGALRCRRDRALMLLMLDGVCVRVRRSVCAWRTSLTGGAASWGAAAMTIPRGVRSKSRRERVVDLYEPATLAAVSDYVMSDRPGDAQSPYLLP